VTTRDYQVCVNCIVDASASGITFDAPHWSDYCNTYHQNILPNWHPDEVGGKIAQSLLRDAVPEWFELDGEVPFMMQVYQIRSEKRSLIPAVTHVDGSGRLQTVYEHTNPRYHGLISAFRDLTGIPMVLNTSFNENGPVVCRPEEALDCFLRNDMDLLVMENWVIRRTRAVGG